MTTIESLLSIAAREIDTQEMPKGSNAGPKVDVYLRACGLNGGYPWCGAFVTWCFIQAGYILDNPRRLAGASNWFTAGRLVSRQQVRPGDVFGLYNLHLGRIAHVGIITEIIFIKGKPVSFRTIEGNTNDAGDREGYEVCARLRPYSQPKVFARWT